MKNVLSFCLVLGVGVALGRMFDRALPQVEAGGNPLPACQDINGDGGSNISDAVFFLNWLFRGGPEPSCPAGNGQPAGVPDTGQTKCYDQSGAEIPCNSATCPGQDGRYATGCPSEGRFVDNGDGTVTDNCTGLMWQKDTADTNGDGQSTDQDFLGWCEALAYCENLSFAGHDDWRLPNVRELQSIVDYGRFDPAVEPVFSVLPENAAYWSSTSSASDPGSAWSINFRVGVAAFYGIRGNNDVVRAVRSVP